MEGSLECEEKHHTIAVDMEREGEFEGAVAPSSLHKDAVQSILKFLAHDEAWTVRGVNRTWHAASHTECGFHRRACKAAFSTQIDLFHEQIRGLDHDVQLIGLDLLFHMISDAAHSEEFRSVVVSWICARDTLIEAILRCTRFVGQLAIFRSTMNLLLVLSGCPDAKQQQSEPNAAGRFCKTLIRCDVFVDLVRITNMVAPYYDPFNRLDAIKIANNIMTESVEGRDAFVAAGMDQLLLRRMLEWNIQMETDAYRTAVRTLLALCVQQPRLPVQRIRPILRVLVLEAERNGPFQRLGETWFVLHALSYQFACEEGDNVDMENNAYVHALLFVGVPERALATIARIAATDSEHILFCAISTLVNMALNDSYDMTHVMCAFDGWKQLFALMQEEHSERVRCAALSALGHMCRSSRASHGSIRAITEAILAHVDEIAACCWNVLRLTEEDGCSSELTSAVAYAMDSMSLHPAVAARFANLWGGGAPPPLTPHQPPQNDQ